MSEDSPGMEKMIALARDDGGRLGELLERYRAFLLLWSKRQIGPKLAVDCGASDVVQQTFAEACRDFPQFRGSTEPEFSAWLKRIHAHNLLDLLRKRPGARTDLLDPVRDPDATASFYWKEPAAKQSTPSQKMIRGEKALRLAAMIQSLPEMQGEAVRLRHLEGLPVQQIAERLDRSVAATAGLIKRGLQKLREKMSQESWM